MNESLLISQIDPLRSKAKRGEVIGIVSASRWQGGQTITIAQENWRVAQCDSVLELRERLSEDALSPLIVVTAPTITEIGDDVRARLYKQRFFPVDPWMLLMARFKAKLVDPALRLQPELAEATLEALEQTVPNPAPTGILTPEAVWQIVISRTLGLSNARPDVQELLEWVTTDSAIARWHSLDEALRRSLRAWLALNLGEMAALLIQVLESGSGSEALAVGLATGALRQTPSESQSRVLLGTAQGRLERYTGNRPVDASLLRQWNEASEQWAAHTCTLGRTNAAREKLVQADKILESIGGSEFVAWYLRNIHLRDMIQTRDDITDGADDKQIDAIFVDDQQETVFVIQGKFVGTSAIDAEPLREVLSAWIQLRDLARLQEVCNNKLKQKLSEVARALEDDYEVCFELLTTAKLTPSAQKDLATFQEQLAELSEKDEFPAMLVLVHEDEIRRRYDMALESENPCLTHSLDLKACQSLSVTIAGTRAVIAVIPLSECIKFPGIKDGTLFQKNVRQSLGLSNVVNKGIKNTIYSDRHRDFFFFHNGITAICNKLEMTDSALNLHGVSVVNGCQSLNTILSCSERVKALSDTGVLFRFYEIPQRERADKISINTNSQSAVKPRDLRSNDKQVLNLKRSYEQKYPKGYFITKRGETPPADRDKTLVIDVSDLGKQLISWHSQRPNVAYSETKIFDKYFEQLFKREYRPENVQALNTWMRLISVAWSKTNPLGLNETLLAMRAYAPYHHLYAISMCFAIANNLADRVPDPDTCYIKASEAGMVEEIMRIGGTSLNMALEAAANEQQPANRVFSPQNWIKAKSCLAGINFAVRNYFGMLPLMPGGKDMKAKLDAALTLESEGFEYRWAAD